MTLTRPVARVSCATFSQCRHHQKREGDSTPNAPRRRRLRQRKRAKQRARSRTKRMWRAKREQKGRNEANLEKAGRCECQNRGSVHRENGGTQSEHEDTRSTPCWWIRRAK